MRHSHILSASEWALTRLNGIARAKARGDVTDAAVQSAAEYARALGASDEQIQWAIRSDTRLRF
jgi:hypothetical protein